MLKFDKFDSGVKSEQSGDPKPEPGPRQGTKEPAGTRLTQQRLSAWRPLLTPFWSICVFLGIGMLFIPIGTGCLAAARGVVAVSTRYDDDCLPEANSSDAREAALLSASGNGVPCQLTMTVDERLEAPVYVYYELRGFYQNHRRYVQSRSDDQLRDADSAITSTCSPQLHLNDDPSKEIVPCGLIAWSLFNDSFTLRMDGEDLHINTTGIAWQSDSDHKFSSRVVQHLNPGGEYARLRGGKALFGNLDEHEDLMVWMNTAPFPTFPKIYGKVERDIPAGSELTLFIGNRYNTYRFQGQKHFILSTASALGGAHPFLGIIYLAVGSCSVLFGLLQAFLHSFWPRKLADECLLSWNRVQES